MKLSLDITIPFGACDDETVERLTKLLGKLRRETQPGDNARVRITHTFAAHWGPMPRHQVQDANPLDDVRVSNKIDEDIIAAARGLACEGFNRWLERVGGHGNYSYGSSALNDVVKSYPATKGGDK